MSGSLRDKIAVLLGAFEDDKVSCSFEEYKEKLSFDSGLKNEERFRAVVEAVCKYSISSPDENGEENGLLDDEGSVCIVHTQSPWQQILIHMNSKSYVRLYNVTDLKQMRQMRLYC